MTNTIGGRVKKYRDIKGLTQDELAHSAGVSEGFIAKLENWHERYRNPTINKIEAIATALAIPPELLIFGRTFSKESSQAALLAPPVPQITEQERSFLKEWKDLNDIDEHTKIMIKSMIRKAIQLRRAESPPLGRRIKSFCEETESHRVKKIAKQK